MTIVKKISVVAVSAALAAFTAVALSGCGEQVAATWDHGKVLESEITDTATKQLSYHVTSDGSTDADSWSDYIANREYDTSSTSDSDSSDSDDSSDDSSSDDSSS